MVAEPNYVDGDPDAPLTRAEFHEALQLIAQSFDRVPTRADLKVVESRLIETLATKADVRRLEERIVDRIGQHAEEVLRKLDALTEGVHRDVARTVRESAIETQTTHQRHDRRLAQLERKLGLSRSL